MPRPSKRVVIATRNEMVADVWQMVLKTRGYDTKHSPGIGVGLDAIVAEYDPDAVLIFAPMIDNAVRMACVNISVRGIGCVVISESAVTDEIRAEIPVSLVHPPRPELVIHQVRLAAMHKRGPKPEGRYA